MGKSVNNEIMLITYADCMGNDLNDLENVLNKYLEGAVGGLHILPFSHHQQTEVLRQLPIKKWIQFLERGKILSG